MTSESNQRTPNGPGAAAILSAALGCLALGVLALAGDAIPAVAKLLNVWNPTGPLSGVTFAAIAAWLIAWLLLSRAWARRDLDIRTIGLASAAMIVASLLLTFPPFMDFLQGK
jgi:hypothetical protein